MISLAGIPFELEVDGELSAAEKQLLAAAPACERLAGTEPFVVRIHTTEKRGEAPAQHPPAVIMTEGEMIRVRHAEFSALVDPARMCAEVERLAESNRYPLLATLRVALGVALPPQGGVLLHGGAIARSGSGFGFFGPSGAGKSTLAAASLDPVLSDEEIVVFAREEVLVTTNGLWTASHRTIDTNAAYPLVVGLTIEKSQPFALVRSGASSAARILTSSLRVQPIGHLMNQALAIVGRIAAAIPFFRVSWTGEGDVWSEIFDAVGPLVHRSAQELR